MLLATACDVNEIDDPLNDETLPKPPAGTDMAAEADPPSAAELGAPTKLSPETGSGVDRDDPEPPSTESEYPSGGKICELGMLDKTEAIS